jgi:hypothetical protein
LEEEWLCKEYGLECSLNETIMNSLNDSAPKAQNCYHELMGKIETSDNFIRCMEITEAIDNIRNLTAGFNNQQIYNPVIELNELNLFDGTFLNETISYCINTRNQQILKELEEGIATPLEIVFQPDAPMYPMKMSSINEGNTKINVYFISDYHVSDSSGLLTTKGKSGLYWASSMSNYDTVNYVTWMTYEGNTKNLTGDSYFVET